MNGELPILLRHLAAVQQRIDQQLRKQQQEIAGLQHALMMSRAALVLGVTRRSWFAAAPAPADDTAADTGHLEPVSARSPGKRRAAANLGKSISALAVEVIICQSGCLSHDAYWRVQDDCLRHGKRCLLLESDEVSSLLSLPAVSAP